MSTKVLVPFPSAPHPADCLVCASLEALPLGHHVEWLYGPGLPAVRDGGAQLVIDSGADVALFVDSDVTFEPAAAKAVIDRARETKGVAAAVFESSNEAVLWNVWPRGVFAAVGPLPPVAYQVGVPGAPAVEVDGLGMGLMAVHVGVFSAILETFPELRLVGDKKRTGSWFRVGLFSCEGGHRELSEDLSFCWRARRAGVPVELVQSATIGHRGRPAPCGTIEIHAIGLGLH